MPQSVAILVNRICKDPAQDNNLWSFLVEVALDEIVKCPAQPHVSGTRGGHEIPVKRLEKKSAVKQVARLFIIGVGLHPEWPGAAQWEFNPQRFSFPLDPEGDFLSLKLPLHHLGHLDGLSIQFNPAVALDVMSVDAQQDIPPAEIAMG